MYDKIRVLHILWETQEVHQGIGANMGVRECAALRLIFHLLI